MIPLITITLTDERRRQIANLFWDAFRHNDQSPGSAAIEAERDRRQFARQVDGHEGSMPSFMRQPDTFWQWLGVAILDEFGLPRELERAAQLRRMVKGRKRMARAEPADEERKVG